MTTIMIQQTKPWNSKETTTRIEAKNLIDDTIDCIKDACVVDSIYEVEVHIYTNYGIVTRSVKI